MVVPQSTKGLRDIVLLLIDSFLRLVEKLISRVFVSKGILRYSRLKLAHIT